MNRTVKVLALHPNDEQKVIKLQKDVSAALKSSSDFRGKVFRHFPLWCEIDGIEKKLDEKKTDFTNKEIAGGIKSVRIFSPVISGCAVLPVEIALENGEVIESKFLLSTFSDCMIKLTDVKLPDFSFEPKIFRIADVGFTGNEYCLCEGVWRKIKK